jgi:flagellar motor switch protein FliM
VSEAALDPEELEAIQAAIRQSVPSRAPTSNQPEATPLALIASDRDAMSARPRLLAVATPWARQLERALRTYLASDTRIEVVGAEVVHGRSLRDELRTNWRGAVRPAGKPGALVVTVGGPIIEVAAARRCGATSVGPTDATREPSQIAIRLFEPAGKACVGALGRAWRERESVELSDVTSADAAVEAILSSDAIIVVTLTVASPCSGRIKLLALPSAAAGAAPQLEATRGEAAAVGRALGHVPVEVKAVLGTIELSLAELRDLQPGATFTLPTFVDSPVPVYCGGVLKAHGKPVVSRGVIAVEIVDLEPVTPINAIATAPRKAS